MQSNNEHYYTTEEINQIIDNHHQGIGELPKIWYRNQEGLRNGNLLFQMSNTERAEYIKCQLDVLYFAENYCRILIPKTGERKHIKLRDYQKDIIKSVVANKFNVNAVSRQVGSTTVEAILIAHSFTFKTDYTIVLIDSKLDGAISKLKKVKDLIIGLPFYMQNGVMKMNSKSIIGSSGTRINVQAATKNAGIGYTVNELYLENLSYYPCNVIESLYKGLMPCIEATKSSKVVITSRPNGHNFFSKLLHGAENKENGFYANRVYWWQVPGRDDEWKEQEIKNLGSKEAFEQEYNLRFIDKGNTNE